MGKPYLVNIPIIGALTFSIPEAESSEDAIEKAYALYHSEWSYSSDDMPFEIDWETVDRCHSGVCNLTRLEAVEDD